MPPLALTNALIARNGYRLVLVALLQTLAPPLVAIVSLYGLIMAYGVHPAAYFDAMAVLVLLLMLLMPYPAHDPRAGVLMDKGPLVTAVLVRWGVLLAALLAIAYVTKFSGQYSRRVVLTWAALTPLLLVASSLGLQSMMRRAICDPEGARRAVLVGCNDSSRRLAARLRASSEYCMNVLGYFDDRDEARLELQGGDRLLGNLSELVSWVQRNNIEVIFVCLPMGRAQRLAEVLHQLSDTTASIYYAPDLYVYDLVHARTIFIQGVPVVSMRETPIYGVSGVTKRLMDVVLSTLLLLLLAPLLLGVALVVKLTSPGPVIFAQRRYGLNGEEIVVYKFRTMRVTEDGAEIIQASRHDPRITPPGAFLRRYSLDELPQLVNVLQGRMSLVGPRPHAVAHNEMYRKLIRGYMIRHKVRPGITGLAQVNGLRGETKSLEDMEARVRQDLEYLRRWSVALDLRILVRTAFRVWNDRAAY
jgi:putative colanic acid biosynthesis UDP-glucose lipid carrier transferase